MFRILGAVCVVSLIALGGTTQGQGTKKPITVIGEVKGHKNTPDGKNTFLEVLAPGEEKAKAYHVMYDPKIKGPVPSILKAVRAAKVGQRVEMECIQTNHGPAITKFKVLSKGAGAAKK